MEVSIDGEFRIALVSKWCCYSLVLLIIWKTDKKLIDNNSTFLLGFENGRG